MEPFSSDEEEDCRLPFWNNWMPPCSQKLNRAVSSHQAKVQKKFFYDPTTVSSVSLLARNCNSGNWIPPLNFFNAANKKKEKITQKRNIKQFSEVTEKTQNSENHRSSSVKTETTLTGIARAEHFSFDWKQRTQLHDVTKFNDGDLMWGVVNLGMFAHINLWVNEYGNICASADGTISKLGSPEVTFISITNAELLRQMLCLSSAQWASLCETIQETKISLNFDAFQDYNLSSKTSLEKLWFFICKRRHFLQNQCMLVKLSGAVKCMRKFKIIPKIVVQEIRTL